MRILAVNWQDPKNPFAGGAEIHLWENLTRFAADGNEVTLVCSSFEGASDEETYDNIRVVRKGGRSLFNYVAPGVVRRELSKNKYDVLIEDINKIPFYTPLYTSEIPILFVIPHLFATTVYQEINFVLGTYIYLWEKPIQWCFRKYPFCVISESTKADLVARGIPAENVSVVECGIDHEMYSPDDSVTKYESPTALYLGRIKKYKGVQYVLKAWPRVLKTYPDARFMVAGDGDYLDNLVAEAGQLGINDSVEFAGYVSSESKVEMMRRSHCIIYPSLKEGWGLTNIEANACGTLALAANSPGLRDSVSDGVSGLLFEHGNVDQLADLIVRVFSDEKLRCDIEQGAITWAERFNWDTSAERLLDVMRRTVNKGRP